MPNLDGALGKVAAKLINSFGKTIIYRHVVNGAYNTTTGKNTTTVTDSTLKATISVYTGGDVRGSIQTGDIKVTCAGTDPAFATIPPSLNDLVVIDGLIYNVEEVNKVIATSLPAVYEFRVRR